MTLRPTTKTVIMVLLTSVSATSLLTSCSYSKRQLDYMTNDRQPQVVAGARRMPAMNPGVAAPMQAPMQQQQRQAAAEQPFVEQTAAPAEEKRAPSYEESPYDHYDQQGNRIDPDKELPAIAEDNFFTRMYDRMTEPSKVEKLRKEPRKPFLDNEYPESQNVPLEQDYEPMVMESVPSDASQQAYAPMTATAPAQQAFVQETPKPLVEMQQAPAPVVYEADEQEVATLPAVEVSEPKEESTWFGRMLSDVGEALTPADAAAEESFVQDVRPEQDIEGEQTVALMEEEVAQPAPAQSDSYLFSEYPELSSVPPSPQSFAEVKEEKAEKMQELQQELASAQQDRAELYAEPSGQDGMIPVEDEVVLQEPVTEEEKVQMMGNPVVLTDASEGEQLLGHVSDKNAPVVTAAPQMDLPAEDTMAVAPETTTEEAPKQAAQSDWWEEWNVFSDKRYSEEVMDKAEQPQQAEAVQMPANTQEQAEQMPQVEAPVELQQELPTLPAMQEPVQHPMQVAEPKADMPWWEQDAQRMKTGETETAPIVEAANAEPETPTATFMPATDDGWQPVAGAEQEPAPEFAAPMQTPMEEGKVQPVSLLAEEEEPLQPLVQEQSPASGSEPVMIPPASDVLEVAEEESGDVVQPANEGLPSTQILREVRTLPASRYSGRRNAY